MRQGHSAGRDLPTRRTTLTLPADSLHELEQIARGRKVNLSVVVAEAVNEAASEHRARRRTAEVLESYRKAFAGFSAEELMILDGVILVSSGKASSGKASSGKASPGKSRSKR